MASSFNAIVDYEDPAVNSLILSAFNTQLSPSSNTLLPPTTSPLPLSSPLLQLRSYETLDFTHALTHPHHNTQLLNAYIIRKALIRKHYLSHTIHSWVTKHPKSPLKRHFAPSVDFELDYAEFLDEALVEAFELRESFELNEGKESRDREWWILKPGMSDRGQGIRVFSCEEELRGIFEGWEEDEDSDFVPDEEDDGSDDDDDDDDDDSSENDDNDSDGDESAPSNVEPPDKPDKEGIITSQLRHFIAQPYLHPPLLLPDAPFNNRKFHVRTYVVAAGALRVYVYEHMLALFASQPYAPPWETSQDHNDTDKPGDEAPLLQRFRDIHLTNSCIQSSPAAEKSDSVHLLSALPLRPSTHAQIVAQIQTTTSELFRAALAQPTNFQPPPQSFEVFGVDFLVAGSSSASSLSKSTDGADADADGAKAEAWKEKQAGEDINVQLLEVNAFPDFGQTGAALMEKVVGGLWGAVVGDIVGPYFGVGDGSGGKDGAPGLTKVLDVDLLRG